MQKHLDLNRLINIIFISSFFVVIVGAMFKYYVTKEYNFFIETSCNPDTEYCYSRDCENDDCPPNGFVDYKRYKLRAYQFDACESDGCENYCHNLKQCIEIPCGDDSEDICSGVQ